MLKMSDIGRHLWGIVLGGACVLGASCANAQITPDRTLPNNSSVTINGSTFNITGGTQAGRNLFHSFLQFSVPNGSTASFNNGLDIQNIISRVTGRDASSIDGIIKANGTANLFFLNPNGIVFGRHASLSIGGSFVASTANSLKFADGFEFSATTPSLTPLLTISVPIGLQYGTNLGSIINQSAVDANNNAVGLMVSSGNSLVLVGGDVSLDGGRLTAPGGRVELGGLAAPGTVGLQVDGNNLSLNFPDGVERASVSLKNSSNVDVSGGSSGSIAVNARNLDLQQSSLTADIRPSSDTPSLRAGGITVNANEAITLGQSSRIESTNAVSNAKVMPHNINITTGSLSMMNGSKVLTLTSGQGNAGNVNINARDNLSFDGSGSGILSIANSTGNAGNISINTGTLSLTNGAGVFAISNGQGSTGSVTLNASDRVSLDGQGSAVFNLLNSSNGMGNSGGISITAGTLSLTNGAQLNTNTNGMGNGGGISITTGTLSLTNGAQLNTSTNGMGNAGDVNINARDTVSSDATRSDIVSMARPQSTGNAGNININTGTLSITNGAGVFADSQGQGKAGSVTINARDLVSLLSGVNIETSATSSTNSIGNNGGISITTGTLSITNTIGTGLNTSTSGMGNAGDVTINARDHVSLDNGRIITSANDTATGKGGDIRITSGDISLANGSLIILSTAGQGNAGNALLKTRSLSLTDGSLVSASSVDHSPGKGGDIQINATESVSLSGSNPIDNRRSTEISTDTREGATGNGGNITIDTHVFRLSDGAIVNARTISNGNAGNITINSKTFEAINGGELVSTSSGSTLAGNIQVHATDWVSVNGSDPTVEERRSIFNNIDHTDLGNVEANSGFFVRSSESGTAGNIEVNAPQIRLDNSGKFIAESTAGNGGNINLLLGDLLLLRHQSLISTTAGNNAFTGNSGNITINAPSGFIVAIPNENSDITANAFSGSGGKVQITATGVYNIAPLSRLELERLRPSDFDPRQLPTNDITAISQQNPSLSGQVTINTPTIDRSQGLVQLPIVVNTPKPVSSSCAAFANSEANSFTVTGRSGLPPSPLETLTNDVVWSDTRLLVTTEQHQRKTHALKSKPQPIAIIPATGWVFNDKGEVKLISSAANATTLNTPTSCPVR